jgi:hypothetical protein
MSKLLEFETEHGIVAIAVREAGESAQAAGFLDNVATKAKESLPQVLEMLKGLASSFEHAIADTSVESAELEVGLDFTGKGSIYLVASEAQAAFKAKLTFKPNR